MATRRTGSKRPERRYVIEGVRREQPDLRKLGRALLAVILAEQRQQEEAQAAEGGTKG